MLILILIFNFQKFWYWFWYWVLENFDFDIDFDIEETFWRILIDIDFENQISENIDIDIERKFDIVPCLVRGIQGST